MEQTGLWILLAINSQLQLPFGRGSIVSSNCFPLPLNLTLIKSQCRICARSKYDLSLSGSSRVSTILAPDVRRYGHSMGQNTTGLRFCRLGSYSGHVLSAWQTVEIEVSICPSTGQTADTLISVIVN